MTAEMPPPTGPQWRGPAKIRALLITFWREWRGFLIFLLVMFSFRSAIADWNDVPSGSMLPTILIGDRILVDKLAYDLKLPFTTVRVSTWGQPRRGDIVVFYSPADGVRLVKRVIGVPGDHIGMINDRLVINGSGCAMKSAASPAPTATAGRRNSSRAARRQAALDAGLAGPPGDDELRGGASAAGRFSDDGRQPRQQQRFALYRFRPAQRNPGSRLARGVFPRPRALVCAARGTGS